MTDDVDLLASYGGPIGRIGGAYFVSAQAKAFAREHQLRGWQGYFIGRCACLGHAPAAVVTSVCGFFPHDFVAANWDAGWQALDAAGTTAGQAAQGYADACSAWGEEHLSGMAGVARLADLAERVVDAADAAGAPLFAGWREQGRPSSEAGRAYLAINQLRELRGGQHLSAVLASGLAPLEAIVSGSHGAANAQFFGWPADANPAVTPEIQQRRDAAEALTDQMAAVPFLILDSAERVEFGQLLAAAGAWISSPGAPDA